MRKVAYVFLLLLPTLILYGSISKSENNPTTECLQRWPVYALDVSIRKGDRAIFYQKIEEFAKNFQFSTRIGPRIPGNKIIYIDMLRDDILIAGVSRSGESKFTLEFYAMQICNSTKAPEDLKEKIGELFFIMANLISQISGAEVKNIEINRFIFR